jgi:DNA mismatch repair ATPase MutL
VTVTELFKNAPVRRQRLSAFDFEDVRRRVVTVAIAHPEVAITFRNSATAQRVIRTTRAASSAIVYEQIFGEAQAKQLTPMAPHTVGQFTVTGFISMSAGHHDNSKQFLYLNGRFCEDHRPIHFANFAIICGLSVDRLVLGYCASPQARLGLSAVLKREQTNPPLSQSTCKPLRLFQNHQIRLISSGIF